VAVSFQMELEHLIGREAPRSPILFDTAGTNVPSLRALFKPLSGKGLKYNSDSIYFDASSRMCYHIGGEDHAKEATELTLPDLSPCSCVAYLLEKEECLRSRQGDLEGTKAELERQRQDFERQHAQHLLEDDDACTGAPSRLCFPPTACWCFLAKADKSASTRKYHHNTSAGGQQGIIFSQGTVL
jgi:hypothetical protein